MSTFYPYVSPCPIEDCTQYLDQRMNWKVTKCGGTTFLSDRGTFACGHMVADFQCRYSCGKGTTEFPFVESWFACKNHGYVYKQCENYEDFAAAMNTLVEFIDLAKPAGVESQTFRRWLKRTTRAVMNQYRDSGKL
ncbi:uncharacterized protein LOC135823958 [Sycon ciliatum]|uniref:uncharacterized protein LOC135823958 n=1 Tax=Sycon ciliatum TaxID=27933 RepID=UPI0031F68DE9|eukprot:scpid90455/ scgid12718/ 